ncbi:GntR family transcriptional regulator [Caldibacillus lycopersici]|uniref:GntR family transcriptional regulator n=1 Tax=Perspicuibacillus lycopersici TaxID=1325689 RepID=A0AAE3IV69_9BACI|nr:GntR family transcriptional regulator [Perspicuibacillus lycopersici]MCU9614193.1 GntR family transcriptional regulator [Perspicuibacillus lycopersici]
MASEKNKQSDNQSKVYLEVVGRIKEIIDENQMAPGDKLPSERELTDILDAGRSSVREALRALELLGLIETRRGEGTFISDFRNHRLVEILSGFILQNEKAKKDVVKTRQLLEEICIYTLMNQSKKIDTSFWEAKESIDDGKFFAMLMGETDNYLLAKIWRIISNFEHSLNLPKIEVAKEHYLQLLKDINIGNVKIALKFYEEEIRKNVDFT